MPNISNIRFWIYDNRLPIISTVNRLKAFISAFTLIIFTDLRSLMPLVYAEEGINIYTKNGNLCGRSNFFDLSELQYASVARSILGSFEITYGIIALFILINTVAKKILKDNESKTKTLLIHTPLTLSMLLSFISGNFLLAIENTFRRRDEVALGRTIGPDSCSNQEFEAISDRLEEQLTRLVIASVFSACSFIFSEIYSAIEEKQISKAKEKIEQVNETKRNAKLQSIEEKLDQIIANQTTLSTSSSLSTSTASIFSSTSHTKHPSAAALPTLNIQFGKTIDV